MKLLPGNLLQSFYHFAVDLLFIDSIYKLSAKEINFYIFSLQNESVKKNALIVLKKEENKNHRLLGLRDRKQMICMALLGHRIQSFGFDSTGNLQTTLISSLNRHKTKLRNLPSRFSPWREDVAKISTLSS